MGVIDNFKILKKEIEETAISCGRNPHEITLLAVSKGQSVENINLLYQLGCRNFGENRLSEAWSKIDFCPKDCLWHFIGTLQKNKVRKAVGCFTMIHSIDSLELAKKISDVSLENNLVTNILLQVNTSGEESKQGMTSRDCMLNFPLLLDLPGIHILGLMTMAPFVDNQMIIRNTFKDLRLLRDNLITKFKLSDGLPHLSMGMSHDFKIAIEEGATILRIGSRIW